MTQPATPTTTPDRRTAGIATGGGRGMGFECGRQMLNLVDHLLLVDLDPESAGRAAQELSAVAQEGVTVEPFVLDISDRDGVQRLAHRVTEIGPLRAVAHAAGISSTMGDWRRVVQVDLIGTALLLDALRPLATSGTSFVCFASMAAVLLPPHPADDAIDDAMAAPLDPNMLDNLRDAAGPGIENSGWAYGLAKRGVKQLVQREAVALGPSGARICSVSPGMITTPQGRQEAKAHASMARMVEQTPLKRMGKPEELASVVAFILSDAASFLNGIDILVDGGVVAAIKTAAA